MQTNLPSSQKKRNVSVSMESKAEEIKTLSEENEKALSKFEEILAETKEDNIDDLLVSFLYTLTKKMESYNGSLRGNLQNKISGAISTLQKKVINSKKKRTKDANALKIEVVLLGKFKDTEGERVRHSTLRKAIDKYLGFYTAKTPTHNTQVVVIPEDDQWPSAEAFLPKKEKDVQILRYAQILDSSVRKHLLANGGRLDDSFYPPVPPNERQSYGDRIPSRKARLHSKPATSKSLKLSKMKVVRLSGGPNGEKFWFGGKMLSQKQMGNFLKSHLGIDIRLTTNSNTEVILIPDEVKSASRSAISSYPNIPVMKISDYIDLMNKEQASETSNSN
jgi:hypothetical protein